MDSSDHRTVDDKLKNRWLMQCVNGERPGTKKQIDITWCLENGADVDTRDIRDNTPLHVAVDRGDATHVEKLLDHGANVNLSNAFGDTPLHCATRLGNAVIMKLLLNDSGAKVNATNIDGDTPLHLAVCNEDAALVEVLVNSKADVNIKIRNDVTLLHWAVRRGDAPLVSQLLKFRAEVDAKNSDGDTPLHEAADRCNAALVKLLTTSKADVNIATKTGYTPLHLVVRRKDESLVELLLKCGADVNTTNKAGDSPLYTAVIDGNVNIVDMLLKSNADVNIPNKAGDTPLHTAILDGKENIINLLLNSRYEVDITDKDGDTLLHLAVRFKMISFLKLLLKRGANTKIKNRHGNTALHMAAGDADASVVELLVNSGSEVNTTNWKIFTPLHCAVQHANVATVRQLLMSGAKVNIKNIYGDPLLHEAANCGNADIVELMLKHDADVSIVDRHGNMPLHVAASSGNAGIVDHLLKYGAKLSILDRHGNAPIHIAARYGHVAVLDVMLAYGADMYIKNINDEAPMHVAVEYKNAAFVEYLLKNGHDIEFRTENGNTPLHLAAMYGATAVVEVICKNGADINAANKGGHTPLHMAVRYKDMAMVELLWKLGAVVIIANKGGETPLHEAVRHKDANIVEQLLEIHGYIDIGDRNGNSPLHLAVHTGYVPIVEMLLNYNADVKSVNKAGNTPLHLAARRRFLCITDLLLRHGADVTCRNLFLDTPLTVARVFNINCKDIMSQLETAENLAKDKASKIENRSQSLFPYNESSKDYLQENSHPGFKFVKRSGTSEVSGHLYETKLLCLVLLRALNDEQIEDFLLGTKIHGIGDMDNICLRYRVRGHAKPSVLFVQAKHRDNIEKRKLTVEDVLSVSGDFSLRKCFKSLLMIEERFQVDNEDPFFEGDFDDVECNLVVYTPTRNCFTKKTTERNVSEKVDYLINTGQNPEVFQYDYDENDMNAITEIVAIEHLKIFGIAFLELIMSEKDITDVILEDKRIARHYVVMRREVLQQCEITKDKKEEYKDYRIWKFRPEFFDSDCNYLIVLKNTFIKELSRNRYDKSEFTNADWENFKLFLQNPCASTISKIIGKLVTYNDKKNRFQFPDVSAFEENIKINEYKMLFEQFNKNINYKHEVYKAVQIKLTALEVKLPLAFGNLDMKFCESGANEQQIIKSVADKLIDLIKINNESKMVEIRDDVVGPRKYIEQSLNIIGSIGSAVGNLLVIDQNTKMLKFNLECKTLPHNAALLLNELKNDRYKPFNEKLSDYRITCDKFPKDSFNGDDFDKKQAMHFISKLWFYSDQAKEKQVERILKNLINKHYNYEKEANNFLLEIHLHTIFLTSHDEILKWSMQKDKSSYLGPENDIFWSAKVACIKNLLMLLIDYVHFFNISSINFNQSDHENDACEDLPGAFNKILGEVFDIFNAYDKPININLNNKQKIRNLLQSAEKLSRYNIASNSDQPQIPCGSQKNYTQQKFKYLKKSETSGESGHFYETKLLCLILIRALNDEQIEDFLIGTNICGIGDMDDICMRYRVNGQDKPVVLFVQAKHRENIEKGKLTLEDVRSVSGGFSLHKHFKSYLVLNERFQVDKKKDPLFEGDFGDVECNLIIYTPAKDCITMKTTERKVSEKVHYLLNTRQNTVVFQYNYDENDVNVLTEITVLEQLKEFGRTFITLIMSDKDKTEVLFANKIITRYHVVIGREVLYYCGTKSLQNNKKCSIWKFRPEFFESSCKFLLGLKSTFIKEASTKYCDKSEIADKDIENINFVIDDPCASTISKIIGKLIIYNNESEKLQLLEVSNIKKKIDKLKFVSLQKQFSKINVKEHVINEAVRIKLTAKEAELPLTFGNLDMTFSGSDLKERIKTVADKLIQLIDKNGNSNIVETSDVAGLGKNVERSIASAVGNLLIKETDSNMLKFHFDNKTLLNNAAAFSKELKDAKPGDDLNNYKIEINSDGFPKCSFSGDEFDKKQARDFLNKLWFYTNQAKENEVEETLKKEIKKFNCNEIRNTDISDPIFLRSHEEMQKWWMSINAPYLSRASELFEHAELTDIDNLLLTVINYMYILRAHSVNIGLMEQDPDYSQFVKMHRTFSKISSRLFNIYDSEYNEAIDIKLPADITLMFQCCDLKFCLEIDPKMEWVSLKLLAKVKDKTRMFSSSFYSLIAKAGPGSGQHRAKGGFLLKQSLDDKPIYFINAKKNPLESLWMW